MHGEGFPQGRDIDAFIPEKLNVSEPNFGAGAKCIQKSLVEAYRLGIQRNAHHAAGLWIFPGPAGLGTVAVYTLVMLPLALASCTAVTMEMYAKHKAWPLEAVHVTLTLDTTPEGTVIDRQILVTGELDTTQRERLLQIANACPVHKILSGTIMIHSGLTPA